MENYFHVIQQFNIAISLLERCDAFLDEFGEDYGFEALATDVRQFLDEKETQVQE